MRYHLLQCNGTFDIRTNCNLLENKRNCWDRVPEMKRDEEGWIDDDAYRRYPFWHALSILLKSAVIVSNISSLWALVISAMYRSKKYNKMFTHPIHPPNHLRRISIFSLEQPVIDFVTVLSSYFLSPPLLILPLIRQFALLRVQWPTFPSSSSKEAILGQTIFQNSGNVTDLCSESG